MKDYAPSNTKKELMGFPGLGGYYRSFCKKLSTVVVPLTNLLKSMVTFEWSHECQRAFENVTFLFCTAPILAAPPLDKPFKLQVDASNVGAGALLLLQDSEDGIVRTVIFQENLILVSFTIQ